MIPLSLQVLAEAERPFVTRLRLANDGQPGPADSYLVEEDSAGATFAGPNGLVALDGVPAGDLDGDVVLVQPDRSRAERLLRAGSQHNTLLVTERCDQLCVMCSQPPRKSHDDRFDLLEQACLLAEPGTLIGISGGEPTLYKEALLGMIERVLGERADLEFHVLTNGQHFEAGDVGRLRDPAYRRVTWGIPLYAPEAKLHDEIVGKAGAFARLEQSMARLIMSGARVELRTVLLRSNHEVLTALARYICARLRFIEIWSIMQLENIGFAKNRWPDLYVRHDEDFGEIAGAIELAALHGVGAQLFNFPRCTVPEPFRDLAAASISDWKRKYAPACALCAEQARCCGFFEWHPEADALERARPL